MTCPRYGSDVAPSAKFCPECGASLRAIPAEERKLVSVLFVDVVGSTARADDAVTGVALAVRGLAQL